MYHCKGAVDIPTGVSLPAYIEQQGQWERRVGEVALQDAMTGRVLTYDRIKPSATAAGRALRTLGAKTIMTFLPNCPEYAVIMMGALSNGVVVSTANPSYTARELIHQLKDSGATLIMTVPAMKEVALEAAEGAGLDTSAVIALGEAGSEPFAILNEGGEVDPEFLGLDAPNFEEDIAVLPYSSGTTGLPKGVMLSHHNMVANIAQLAYDPEEDSRVIMDGTDTQLCVLPMFHIYAMMVAMFLPLALGTKVITMPRFDPEVFLTTIQKEKITYLPLVPPLMLFLAKHPVVEKFDLSSIKVIYTAAAPCDAQLQQDVQDRLGVPAIQIYGMTELSPGALTTPGRALYDSGMKDFKDVKYGSVGIPLPNTDCKIINPETGAECAVDEPGELYIKGPQVMLGYYNNKEATEGTMDGEYLKTGDIFVRDADGHHFAVDRLKELIKVKGFQVPPAELEGIVISHPAIADAAVIPMKDDEAGELPLACVVLKPDHQATEDEVKEYVSSKVAHYKRLGAVKFIEAVPKTPSGKILRRVLRDQYA